MASVLRVCAVQLNSGENVSANLEACEEWVGKAKQRGAKFVVLPENFAYFGAEAGKRKIAESREGTPGQIRSTLAHLAVENSVYLLAGGWPERSADEDRPYNAATLFAPSGSIIAHYRKIHLFDVTLPNGVALTESASTAPGTSVTVCDVLGTKVGLSICYDLRFPELYRALVDGGAQLLAVPSAFTLETGKDHWALLNRARAVESQCWVVAANQWGSHGKGRNTYGHSMVVDPWGAIVAEASDRVGIVVADVDLSLSQQIRARLPCLDHRRLGRGTV